MRIKTKEDRRDRIKFRIRKKMAGTSDKPRLSVFRSVSHIYVQVIDDRSGQTIASASSIDPKVKGQLAKGIGGGFPFGARDQGMGVGKAQALDVEQGIHNQLPWAVVSHLSTSVAVDDGYVARVQQVFQFAVQS